MNWYNGYKSEWKEILETISRELKKSELIVEKDTIQSMFLLDLSKTELPLVFKGGTSLSKVYNIIDRFSEDIDLSANRKLTQAERKKSKEYIINIAKSLGMELTNPNQLKSRYDYNKFIFNYKSLFSNHPLEIIIETNFFLPVYPVEKHEIKSLVGQFCQNNKITLPVPFEASTVVMDVQSIERTFIDKVFAICDYRLQDLQERDSRHLYDICKLLPNIKFNKELSKLVDEVRSDRIQSKNNPSAQYEHNIPEILNDIITSHYFESDYRSVTQKLLYEDISYDYAIEKGIAIIANSDLLK